MNTNRLSVRELRISDIPFLVTYWTESEDMFMERMGVDLTKLPKAEELSQMLENQLEKPMEEKRSYCIIWEMDGTPIGHCNTNPTVYGEEAYMHLHIWDGQVRKKGMGLKLLKMTLPYFFDKLKLKRLFSEPYALNNAPNRTLEKAGFQLIKEYITIPGSLNFEQPVKRWELTVEGFRDLLL